MGTLEDALATLRAERDRELAVAEAAAARARVIAEAVMAIEGVGGDQPPSTPPPVKPRPRATQPDDGPSDKFAARARAASTPRTTSGTTVSHKARKWDYAEVATVANAARERGESMRAAVVARFGCSPPSADMAISTARKKGHEIAAGDPGLGGRTRHEQPAPPSRPTFGDDDALALIGATG